ncbi:MAG: hypothetical protein ABI977_36830, partial [Acidobacteriota bacterium]
MNQQANETVDYLTSEDTEDQDFFEFADLALTDVQLAEIKGGPGTGWCSQCVVIFSNHNETTAEDEEAETDDELFDLLVAEAQAEDVKGGCINCGVKLNHNEITAEDDEAEANDELFDLLV